DRRCFHGGAFGRHAHAQPRLDRGGLRRRASLQRPLRRNVRRRRSGAAACRRGCASRSAGACLAATGARHRRGRGARALRGHDRGPPRRRGSELLSEEQFSFDPEVTAERASNEPALIVDVEGFEGPLDLLLILARQQKVDLAKISILALADQYLAFIEAARQLRMELAADYLVMAAR